MRDSWFDYFRTMVYSMATQYLRKKMFYQVHACRHPLPAHIQFNILGSQQPVTSIVKDLSVSGDPELKFTAHNKRCGIKSTCVSTLTASMFYIEIQTYTILIEA